MLVNLKSLLNARRLRQFDIAIVLKISPSQLSDIIHQRCQLNSHLRQRLARELDADPSWLFRTDVAVPPYPQEGEDATTLTRK